MKTGMRLLAALAVLVSLEGCDEKNYFVTTIVSIEGAIDRMVEWRGVSDSTKWTRLPVPVDSTWRVSFRSAAPGDSTAVLTVSKHFNSFDELTREYAHKQDPLKVRLSVTVERRFRWFYTYVDYAETYADPQPVTSVAAGEFFTRAEYQRIASGEITDTLRSRIRNWQDENTAGLIFTGLLSAVEDLHDAQLTPSLFLSEKSRVQHVLMGDSIYAGIGKDSASPNPGRVSGLNYREIAVQSSEPAIRALRDIFKTDAVEKLREAYIRSADRYFTSQEKREAIQGHYTNTVVMPGVIVETNAPDVSGNRVSWKVDGDQMTVMDVSMHVVSRVVNVWAIVISALVVVGLILVPVVVRKRQPVG